jgi:hypothetical protein
MNTHLRRWSCLILLVAASMLFGCSAAQKTAPRMGFGEIDIQANIDRKDIVVLNEVEGSSTLSSILGPFIQIIDGDKYRILGMRFFKDKYSYAFEATDPVGVLLSQLGIRSISTKDRAYYKALEKAPEADVILYKKCDTEVWHFMWFIYSTESVTVRGKAVALRPDR